MNKFMTTFLQTYISKVRAKSFIFTTLLVILLIFAAANFDKIIDLFDTSEDVSTVEVEAEEAIAVQYETILEEVSSDLNTVDSDGDVTVTIESGTPLSATVESEEEIPDRQSEEISLALNETSRTMVIESLDITQEDAMMLTEEAEVEYEVTSLSEEEAAETEDGLEVNPLDMVIFYLTVFGMFFIVINYASQIAMEISMEKSSRVIEMIVSSVKPISHVLAKISAIISVSFTQLFFFIAAIVAAILIFDIDDLITEFGLEASDETSAVIIYSIIFLVLGLVLYLTVSALLGSFVSRMEDLQQALMPVTFLSIGGMWIAMFNLMNPEGLVVKISSYFPFFTPFVMPLRILDDSTGQMTLIIGIVILLVSIVIAVFLAASIYRNSVLSTESGIMKNLRRIRKE